jgi:hypothetical protein
MQSLWLTFPIIIIKKKDNDAFKAYMVHGAITPLILNLSTRWSWVVNFHALAALPHGTGTSTH